MLVNTVKRIAGVIIVLGFLLLVLGTAAYLGRPVLETLALSEPHHAGLIMAVGAALLEFVAWSDKGGGLDRW